MHRASTAKPLGHARFFGGYARGNEIIAERMDRTFADGWMARGMRAREVGLAGK